MLKKIRDAIGRNRVVGRAKFLRDRLFYRYFRAQGAARAREFAKNLLSSGSSRLCFTIAFNTPWVIDALTKAWQVHPTGMLLVVIDNSSDEAARKSIEDICRHRGVPYFSLPRNRERHWSRSHGTAVNWVFDNIVRKVRPELFGFIDHDCFPITPFDMPGRMQGKKVFGLKFGPTENFRYKASRNDRQWCLWGGFCFFRFSAVENVAMDFTPRMELGLDTGGGNWLPLYSHLAEEDVATVEMSFIPVTFGGTTGEHELFEGAMFHVGGSSYAQLTNTRHHRGAEHRQLLSDYIWDRYLGGVGDRLVSTP